MKCLSLFLLLLIPVFVKGQNACVSMAVIGSPCAPASFQLFACTPDASNAEWSFPGSLTPTQSGLYATVVYPNAGTYNISVTIEHPGGLIDTFFNVFVSDFPEVCVSAPVATGCTGQTLCFDATCTSGIGLTYVWDFGDGGSSTLDNACHSYTDSGCYDIQLVITDSFGCQSDTVLPTFACVDPVLVACFTSVNSPCNCSAPYTVALQSCSTPSSGLVYQWNTPGGNAATPTASTNAVTYNSVGFYDVSLIVTDSGGCSDTMDVQDFVCISSFSPTFEILDSVFVTGVPIMFLAGPAMSFAWTVTPTTVDTTDDDQILTAVFNQPGTYEVCLQATFNGCAAEKCTTLVITNPTSILETELETTHVYYNNEQLTVTTSEFDDEIYFSVFDITGRIIFSEPVNKNSTRTFNISTLVSGVYGYSLTSNSSTLKRGLFIHR